MQDTHEQRTNIKFCVQLGHTPLQALSMMRKVHGEKAPSQRTLYRWYKRFKQGQTSVLNNPRPGRPVSVRTFSNISNVKSLLNSDRRLTFREISDDLKINQFTTHQIIAKDLKMKRVGATMMPRVLTEEQREKRVKISQEMLSRVCSDEDMLSKVVTMDESWVYGYDPETLRMCSQWKTADEPRPRKVKASKSSFKTMLLLFFDEDGVVHEEYLPQAKSRKKEDKYTVNAEYFIMVLHKFIYSMKTKRPEKVEKGWILHMDNAFPILQTSLGHF